MNKQEAGVLRAKEQASGSKPWAMATAAKIQMATVDAMGDKIYKQTQIKRQTKINNK